MDDVDYVDDLMMLVLLVTMIRKGVHKSHDVHHVYDDNVVIVLMSS